MNFFTLFPFSWFAIYATLFSRGLHLHLLHQWYYGQEASVLHRIIKWEVNRVSDDEGIECTVAQIFPNT